MVAGNLDFISKKEKVFSEAWKKVDRQGYIECYKSQVNCKNGKRITQYIGVNDEQYIMSEASAVGF